MPLDETGPAAAPLAAVLQALGEPPRLETVAWPGAPASGEVVCAMKLAPINPADLLSIAGRYALAPPPPFVLGAEGVGEVIAVGPDTPGVALGDLVLPLSRGNWTGLRRLRTDEILKAPPGLPAEQLAMLRINAATAWRLLAETELEAGDSIIQNAANSSVAHLVRLLARQRGLNVVDVVRSHAAAGVGGCRLPDGPDLGERVRAAVGDRLPKLALDCVAGAATGRLAECVAPEATLVVFGHLSGRPCEIPSTVLTAGRLTVRGFSLRPAEAADTRERLGSILAEMAELLRPERARMTVRETFGLSQLALALEAAQAGGGGRVLLALDR